MARKPRKVTFRITLAGEDLERWTLAAKSQSLTLEKLVRESVETSIARGSTR